MIISFGGKGGESESKFRKEGRREIAETQKSTQERQQEQQRQQQSEQRTTGRTLDVETEQLLRDTIGAIAGSGDLDRNLAEAGIEAQEESIEFARGMGERALGTQEFVNEQIGRIVEEARMRSVRDIQQQETRLGTQAGSRLNTFVQEAVGRGFSDLETQLGALEADIILQGRELESRDLAAASDALQTAGVQAQIPGTTRSGGVADIASLASILRGATTETETIGAAEEQAVLEETALMEQLRELLETFQESGKVETEGFELSGGFGF